MKRLAFFLAAALLLSSAETYRQARDSRGLEFELVSRERSALRDGKLPIEDLEIRITNANPRPIWIGTMGDHIASGYLRERNPSNLRFRLRRKDGERWTAMRGGYYGSKSGMLLLKPTESVTVTLPIADRDAKGSTMVQAIFDTSFEAGGANILSVVTPGFELLGEEKGEPELPPAVDPPDPVEE